MEESILLKNIIYDAFFQVVDTFTSHRHLEMVDINNRFRSIVLNGKRLFVKKCTVEEAVLESENAREAYKRISGVEIEGILLDVVIPELVIIDNDAYLVTPDLGITLQTQRYLQLQCCISSNQLRGILHLLCRKGIAYRGFLPRNSFLKEKNHLSLIDWEETTFYDEKPAPLNYFWETNYLLNWGYYFDRSVLQEHFAHLEHAGWDEPPLKQYELILCALFRMNPSTPAICRKEILEFVLAAEKPSISAVARYKFPNDCAHMIADLFRVEIDVFFDMVLYCMNEYMGRRYSDLLGQMMLEGYHTGYIQRREIMMLILCAAFDALTEREQDSLFQCDYEGKRDLLNSIVAQHPQLCYYKNGKTENFASILCCKICQMVRIISGKKADETAVNAIARVIISLAEGGGL